MPRSSLLRVLTFAALALPLGLAAPVRPAHAQGEIPSFSDRAPRFLTVVGGVTRPLDVRTNAALNERISLDLQGTTIKRALTEIIARSGLRLIYRDQLLPADARVHLRAAEITVGAALVSVLMNAGVDVAFDRSGGAVLMPREQIPAASGTVAGRVTDGKTGDALPGAEVWLEGTKRRAATNDKGYYRLADVEVGNYTLSVRRVGYAKQSRAVTVAEQELTVDVALVSVVTQLDELVTTVTGDRRARELGHVIGRINADSLVKEAPISSISELLTGRIPGLQVFQSSGTVGGDVQLKVRTPNSLMLSTQPIVIVDGVRYTSTAALDWLRQQGANAYGSSSTSSMINIPTEATSPLNDLNPNDLESIEVVKGSAAATLYGTDASNGVIVITTKRGRPGPARWNVYLRGGLSETPNTALPTVYQAYGTHPSGFTVGCPLHSVADGFCTQDSIVALSNPFENPATTIFSSAPQWQYGLSASGGTPGLNYYVSGSFDRATGPIQMPQALIDSIEEARGAPLPDNQLLPNAQQNINLRSNLSATLSRFSIQGNLGYVRRTSRTLSPLGNPYVNPRTSAASAFNATATERVDRFIVGGGASWQPTSWLMWNASAGLDLGNQTRYSLTRRGELPPFFGTPSPGSVQNAITDQRSVSGNVGFTAHFRSGRLGSRTSVGAQYNRALNDVQFATGYDLAPGGESVQQAANRTSNQVYSESVTLGTFVEQSLSLNERLYFIVGVRMDGASNFGQSYDAVVYPKFSLSWVPSEEPFFPRLPGIDELRIRAALGVSGQQAFTWMARPTFEATTTSLPPVIEGTTSPLVRVTALGNPDLRPERAREYEFGFDLTGLGSRVQLALSWFHRRVTDQIVTQTLPAALGSMARNLALTKAHGFEAGLNVSVVNTRTVTFDMNVSHSRNRTQLIDGDDDLVQSLGYRKDYPLDAIFSRKIIGYSDANGDGIINYEELQHSTAESFIGVSTSPTTQGLGANFGFFDRRVRLAASFGRSAGSVMMPRLECSDDKCLALLDPNTPIAAQAQALGSQFYPPMVRADFIRLREVSLGVELPARTLRRLGVRSGSLSVSVRNLAEWTSYPNGDPDAVRLEGANTRGGFSVAGSNIPQARTWTLRLDLGL